MNQLCLPYAIVWAATEHMTIPNRRFFKKELAYSLLPKIDEIKSNAYIIGISESKLDSSILYSELDIDEYDLIRLDCSRRGGGAVCYVRKALSFNHKTIFYRNIESILTDIFLPKSKPILVGVLYRPPDKPDFIEHLNNSLKESNISNTQESYLIGDFNINLLSGKKMLLIKTIF